MSVTNPMLTQIAADVRRALFTESCVVKTRPASATAVTTDGAPDDTDAAWPATTVDCRAVGVGGDTRAVGMKRAAEADKMLSMPVGTAIKAFDRVVYRGATYEVIETSDPRTWSVAVHALVKAVT